MTFSSPAAYKTSRSKKAGQSSDTGKEKRNRTRYNRLPRRIGQSVYVLFFLSLRGVLVLLECDKRTRTTIPIVHANDMRRACELSFSFANLTTYLRFFFFFFYVLFIARVYFNLFSKVRARAKARSFEFKGCFQRVPN